MTPIFDITLAGESVPLSDRLLSLEITDQTGIKSDQLSLSIADPDSVLTLPHRGVELTAALGYAETGLVNKGTFIVDEIEYSSPPNVLEIVARAANFRGSFRQKREESYHDTTLGAILRTLAGRNKYTPIIAEVFETIGIPHIDQTVSDSEFFKFLADRYDALCAIKSGRLVFLKSGEGKTASGAQIPAITIHQSDCANWRLSMADRANSVTGVEARYIYRPDGQTDAVLAGTGDNPVTLRGTYPTKAEALAAAQADLRRRNRKGKQIRLTLAVGKPELIAETPIILSGFKADIDGSGWIASEVAHSLGSGGLSNSMVLETV